MIMCSLTAIVAFSSIFVGILAAPQGAPAPRHKDSFESSCRRWNLKQEGNNAWLEALCLDSEGLRWHSVINLNHCIANDFGQLAGRAEGRFADSCSGMELRGDTALAAQCARGGGGSTAPASIRLGDVVSNDNGELSCFGIRGCAIDGNGCADKPAGK